MQTIILKRLAHRNIDCIAICFTNSRALNDIVKRMPGIKWSHTNKCWWLPLSKENYTMISHSIGNHATIDNSLLKTFLQKRKQVKAVEIPASAPEKKALPMPKAIGNKPAYKLCPANLTALEKFIQQLQLKAYSPSNIKTHRNEFMQLLQILKTKAVDSLQVDDIKRYMLYAMKKEGITENTAHSRLNALKFYYEQVLGREKFFGEIPRPKKISQLPKVFNQDEIAAIINSLQNKKHKVMLMLAYRAGFRVSEVVALKTYNIDSSRMVILIKEAKGKKDRIESLSPVMLVMLREYALAYKPEKKGYLFEGSTKGAAYSTRSLQEVIQAAKSKAGVLKPGSIHCLRHSFATHLIDKGTDVTMIQKLSGHNDIKTTLRYLHTSNKDLLKIISPLDDLKLT